MLRFYGITSAEAIKNKKIWRIFDVKDDMGELPPYAPLIALRRFRAKINSVGLAKDAMARKIISDPQNGKAFAWYVEQLYGGEKTVQDLTLEELRHHLEEFASASKEKYIMEYKQSAYTGPEKKDYSDSKDYIVNNAYFDAIKINPDLKTMSYEVFEAIRKARLDIDQKEIILREWKATEGRVKDSFYNLRENEWSHMFNNKAEHKFQFKKKGKLYLSVKEDAYAPSLETSVHQKYKTEELAYEFAGENDGVITYNVYKGTRPVATLEIKDGLYMRFKNL